MRLRRSDHGYVEFSGMRMSIFD